MSAMDVKFSPRRPRQLGPGAIPPNRCGKGDPGSERRGYLVETERAASAALNRWRTPGFCQGLA